MYYHKHIYPMDDINNIFDNIISNKTKEIEELFNSKTKNRKMNVTVSDTVITDTDTNTDIDKTNYSVNKTISAINKEYDRKLKASKAYKKKQAANDNS